MNEQRMLFAPEEFFFFFFWGGGGANWCPRYLHSEVSNFHALQD